MTQAELAHDLEQDHDRLEDLIGRFGKKGVTERYEILMESIANRFSKAGLPEHAKTFRPTKGIAMSYSSGGPGAELAKMNNRADKLEAIIEELRQNPEVRLKTKPTVVSHDPDDIADDLAPVRAELRELARRAPDISEDDYKPVLRKASARLRQSGLEKEAEEFTPPLLGREGLEELKIIVGRHGNRLDKLIKSLRQEREYWMGRVRDRSGHAPPAAPKRTTARRPAKTSRARAYINKGKIADLKKLRPPLENIWDLAALIELCEGINSSYADRRYRPVAMMLRAVMDHVPPLFGEPNFDSVIAHAKPSPKKIYKRMYEKKDIFDFLTHNQIAPHISKPGPEVIDIRNDFHFLLDRVIELLKGAVPAQ